MDARSVEEGTEEFKLMQDRQLCISLGMISYVPEGKCGTLNVGRKESGGVIGVCELSRAGLSLDNKRATNTHIDL
jgi:hypothetical protein